MNQGSSSDAHIILNIQHTKDTTRERKEHDNNSRKQEEVRKMKVKVHTSAGETYFTEKRKTLSSVAFSCESKIVAMQ